MPDVPASESVWQVPQDCVKICLPSADALAPPPPPPPPVWALASSGAWSPPPLSGETAASPPPPDSSVVLSSITSAGMPRPNATTIAPNTSTPVGARRRTSAPTKRARPISARASSTSKAAALCHAPGRRPAVGAGCRIDRRVPRPDRLAWTGAARKVPRPCRRGLAPACRAPRDRRPRPGGRPRGDRSGA